MENTLKKLLSDNIAGNHIIGRDMNGTVRYKASIENYTTRFHHNGKTGETEESFMLTLNDGKMMKVDVLSETFIPQWEDNLKYEMTPFEEVNISCFLDLDVVGLTVLGFDTKHDAVKFRAVIDECESYYDSNFVTGEPIHTYSLHMDNGAIAEWDDTKDLFIPLYGCPSGLEYKIVESDENLTL